MFVKPQKYIEPKQLMKQTTLVDRKFSAKHFFHVQTLIFTVNRYGKKYKFFVNVQYPKFSIQLTTLKHGLEAVVNEFVLTLFDVIKRCGQGSALI